MMGFRLLISYTLALLISGAAQAEAITDKQFSAIQAMGELNGVALNCHYLNETQRMKKALVIALPKRRQFGEVFDTETNNAFLRFIENKSSCPAEDTFSKEVDSAILVLDSVFADK